MLDDRFYQGSADAPQTVKWRNVKLFKPGDDTGMLYTLNRDDIRNADHLTGGSCQQEKAARLIRHNLLQNR